MSLPTNHTSLEQIESMKSNCLKVQANQLPFRVFFDEKLIVKQGQQQHGHQEVEESIVTGKNNPELQIQLPVKEVSSNGAVWEEEEPHAHQFREIGEDVAHLIPGFGLVKSVPTERSGQGQCFEMITQS